MDEVIMKTAFLFPGQGAQLVSMGKDIAEAFPLAAEIFDKANEIVGFDLKKLCFEGPEQELNTTIISQPAIFTVSAAILEVIKASTSLNPDVTAGLSLGEYSALYAAGNISFEDGLKLVFKRATAMQKACDTEPSTMAAIIGLEDDNNKGGVFARVISESVVDFSGGSDKAGGFLVPNMSISGLSKLQGPVSGALNDMKDLKFIPEEFFAAFENLPVAKIFGVIEILNTAKTWV